MRRAVTRRILAQVWAAVFAVGTIALMKGQAPSARGSASIAIIAQILFGVADVSRDGFVTRDELKTTFSKWFSAADPAKTGSVSQAQLAAAVNGSMSQLSGTGGGRGVATQNQTPKPEDVAKMMAALPDAAYAKPLKARKVLVLCNASGFVHSSIPLAAKTVEALGTKTGAWTTTITYDSADITTANLRQYDVLFLNNNTGAFLDDPSDSRATAARKAALLAFVRDGKGLAGVHAASDSYYEEAGESGAGGAAAQYVERLVAVIIAAGDKNGDEKLSSQETASLADGWYDRLDPDKTGKVSRADFMARFPTLVPAPAPGHAPVGVPQGPDNRVGTWSDFNNLIAGFFKFHWLFPQEITVKIDDPKSPLTAMFHGQEFVIHDETYTMSINSSWSRKNVHVLTSIDYGKMSAADKAEESNPRSDHDYGLSWIRREGQGRVFYEAHGHDESIFAIRPMLEHILAGVQYAAGDLKADDSPSIR